jgi:hypothetical protein
MKPKRSQMPVGIMASLFSINIVVTLHEIWKTRRTGKRKIRGASINRFLIIEFINFARQALTLYYEKGYET